MTSFRKNNLIGKNSGAAPSHRTCRSILSKIRIRSLLPSVICLGITFTQAASALDTLVFGDESSEEAHELTAELSQRVEGERGLPARQMLPPEKDGWRGGRLTFRMEVDPDQANYFTAKFWGGDTCGEDTHEARLTLYVEGKQLGTRHLGDIDSLDIMKYDLPRYPGRFFYKTVPLPLHMTRGQTSVELSVEGQGGINGYASKIEDYQKMMKEPSRRIYRAYTHTEACFHPEENEVQGMPPVQVPIRSEPGVELIEKLKKELNDRSTGEMNRNGSMHVYNIQYLAHAYITPWNTAYKNPRALERIVEGIDGHYLDFHADPKTVEGERWVHKGPIGDAVRLLHNELKPYLNQKIPGRRTQRRQAWAALLVASRNRNCAGRRSYTNQCMIKDLNTYYCDLAVRRIYPSKAWSVKTSSRLLYEAMGLEPFSGNWSKNGNPDWSQGKNKMLLTKQGLTKELGYVGAYGEIISDSGVMIYEATKPSPDQEGDPRIKAQLIKMIRARAPFRYPLVDKEGYRSMNLEVLIGWRDWKYPGGVIYDQTNGRDGGAFEVAVSTGDQVLLGYGQQMLEDNQYFAQLKERMASRHTNSKTYLLKVPEQYEIIASLPPQSYRLPMTPGQPDFVFSDTDDGVIAFKNQDDIFYGSLYWRARHSINNLARVHYMTPTIERDSIVNIETVFDDSGHVYTIPDRTNQGFSRGRAEDWYAKQGIHQALAGIREPIARVPDDDDTYEVGREHPLAGKAKLYLMAYGPYYVAMNCTDHDSFKFDLPREYVGSKDLVSGQNCHISHITIRPRQTIVLYRGKEL